MSVRVRLHCALVLGLVALLAATLMAPAPSATAVTAAPYCGLAVHRKADGTRWRCTFADDFSGTKLNGAKWVAMSSATSNFGKTSGCFTNSSKNVAVANGVLRLAVRRASAPFVCGHTGSTFTTSYTSALISTVNRFSQAYGRFEIRAKFPYTTHPGLVSSIWLWPKDTSGMLWPVTGEIDIAEWFSHYPDRVIPYLHSGTGFLTPTRTTNNYCLVANVANWHTYLLEWTPKGITIGYDGHICLTNPQGGQSPFDKPYFAALSAQIGKRRNAPSTATPFPSTTQIDWFRVWS